MAYKISIDPGAVRDLKKLTTKVRQQVADAISALATDPRPQGAQKLSGSKSSYRIRVGDFRVLYQIVERELLVLVVKVGHRREVYR